MPVSNGFAPRDGVLTFTGQMKYLERIIRLQRSTPKMIVMIHAPTKPSTVFFGDNLMSCVLPIVIPTIYAHMSFVMTRLAGRKNQIMPSKTLFMMKWAWMTIRYRAMWVHAKLVNWNL